MKSFPDNKRLMSMSTNLDNLQRSRLRRQMNWGQPLLVPNIRIRSFRQQRTRDYSATCCASSRQRRASVHLQRHHVMRLSNKQHLGVPRFCPDTTASSSPPLSRMAGQLEAQADLPALARIIPDGWGHQLLRGSGNQVSVQQQVFLQHRK